MQTFHDYWNGWTITVFLNVYGMWSFIASKTGDKLDGIVSADDETEAIHKVCLLLQRKEK
jgi:hypothetical protein